MPDDLIYAADAGTYEQQAAVAAVAAALHADLGADADENPDDADGKSA